MTLPTLTVAADVTVAPRIEGAMTEESLRHEIELLRRRVAELEAGSEPKNEARTELHARSDALAERLKELHCLHAISGLIKGRHDLGDILQRIADVLPAAWQYPELARSAITLRSRRYQTQGFDESRWRQQAPLVIDDMPMGALEIGYIDLLPDGREPEFLAEEQILLSTVAERIVEIIALKESQKTLSTYQEHLRSLASELTLTEERERRSLALCLHDRIGQGLAVVKLKLETLRHLLPAEHQPRLDDVSALIKQIVNDTRTLTFEISPPILYELGLKQAIIWLGENMTRQFGIPVEVRSDEELVELTEGVRVMLFRSIQELLTNTVKHAQASRATVRLMNDADELCVVVEDDGVGFDMEASKYVPTAAGGFGLFSIRERIAHLGGRVDICSGRGTGTRIQISVPESDADATREEHADEDSSRRQS